MRVCFKIRHLRSVILSDMSRISYFFVQKHTISASVGIDGEALVVVRLGL